VTGLKIGHARVSTVDQDLTAQRDGLAALGVDTDRVYVDHSLTGTTRVRPGLREALAACRTGDTLVVTKLDRLARPLPDARDIVEELTGRGVRLQLGDAVMTRPTRSGGCSSTCSRWSPSSRLSGHAETLTSLMCEGCPDALSTGKGGRCKGYQAS
jgi:hypothetical protein